MSLQVDGERKDVFGDFGTTGGESESVHFSPRLVLDLSTQSYCHLTRTHARVYVRTLSDEHMRRMRVRVCTVALTHTRTHTAHVPTQTHTHTHTSTCSCFLLAQVAVFPGDTITWSTDYSLTAPGFCICTSQSATTVRSARPCLA
jgi:hypothetical protein